jgi:hypothetical protein
MRPKVTKKLAFVHPQSSVHDFQERTAGQAEKSHQLHHGKAAAWFLAPRLRIGFLTFGRIGHRAGGAIDYFNTASQPQAVGGDIALQSLRGLAVDS